MHLLIAQGALPKRSGELLTQAKEMVEN